MLSDASQNAYATCIYLRSTDNYGNYYVQLLCSKTKVSPLKQLTIPRLELCACLLGAKLINSVKACLNIEIPIIMWSDSQIALWWINTEPSSLQTFVSNRVSIIQSLTKIEDWKYCSTNNNPADIASRGVLPKQFMSKSSHWWTGPDFLRRSSTEWPSTSFRDTQIKLPELKTNVFTVNTNAVISSFSLFHKFSDFNKLKRVTAYCIRFIKNKFFGKRLFGQLTVNEMEDAHVVLIKIAQKESFSDELKILCKNKCLPMKHKFASLALFLDNNGVIRVGGRLKNTFLPFNIKHPMLLSSKHIFTKLVFEYKHKQLLHPGPQLLLSSIRQFYWAVGGLNLAKKTVKTCMTCFKFNPVPLTCSMASLPNDRVKIRLPFEITGIDYAGPFSILNRRGRGVKIVKCYLAVFICFCTKAVHFEVVSDLTTENFLACLKRFISRRGIPSVCYSDNGSTFVGARNEMNKFGQFLYNNHKKVIDSTSHLNLTWKFIPPYTPNHGGLWEAAVKSAKHFLKRSLFNKNVTYEEFNTLVIQVEAISNSRPLFASSIDPNDIAPITPSHFLIGRVLTSLPEPDLYIATPSTI